MVPGLHADVALRAHVSLLCLSLSALTLALKTIDISVAYAVWSGLGTALIATVGVLWMKEPLNTLKIASLMLIIIGVIGLHLSGGER